MTQRKIALRFPRVFIAIVFALKNVVSASVFNAHIGDSDCVQLGHRNLSPLRY